MFSILIDGTTLLLFPIFLLFGPLSWLNLKYRSWSKKSIRSRATTCTGKDCISTTPSCWTVRPSTTTGFCASRRSCFPKTRVRWGKQRRLLRKGATRSTIKCIIIIITRRHRVAQAAARITSMTTLKTSKDKVNIFMRNSSKTSEVSTIS